MTKKLFTLLLAVTASIGTMFAEKVQIGDLYYNLDATNQTAEVTSSSDKYFGDIIIPSSVIYNSVSYSVTSIGEWAFSSCSGLTSIEIPNSVTSIGEWAFDGCSSLTSIDVESNNPNYCSVEGVLFNKNKTILIQYPMGKQGAYTMIPNSVTNIGGWAFEDCTGLTSVTIPNSVTSIGESALRGCTGLTSVTIPGSVTSIGEGVFYNCTGLTSIIVENGNSFYDSRNNCNAIIETATNTLIVGCMNTIIPNSVTSIEGHAFSFCSGLTSVTIPGSVSSIGDYAFSYCSGLTSVTNFANTPQEINWTVFNLVDKSTCKLYVPENSIPLYRVAIDWRDFAYIEAIETSQRIETTSINLRPSKLLKDGQIFILRGEKEYTVTGQEVK